MVPKREKEAAGEAGVAGQSLRSLLDGLNEQLLKAGAMMALYEKHANSEIRSQVELEQARQEMGIIKEETLSTLLRAKKALQRLQEEVMT